MVRSNSAVMGDVWRHLTAAAQEHEPAGMFPSFCSFVVTAFDWEICDHPDDERTVATRFRNYIDAPCFDAPW